MKNNLRQLINLTQKEVIKEKQKIKIKIYQIKIILQPNQKRNKGM